MITTVKLSLTKFNTITLKNQPFLLQVTPGFLDNYYTIFPAERKSIAGKHHRLRFYFLEDAGKFHLSLS